MEAVNKVVRSLRQVAAVGPGARPGHEVLPCFLVERPVGKGHAACLVADERPTLQLTGDGQDELVKPVIGLPDGGQSGRGRECSQDLPVPGSLREPDLAGRLFL